MSTRPPALVFGGNFLAWQRDLFALSKRSGGLPDARLSDRHMYCADVVRLQKRWDAGIDSWGLGQRERGFAEDVLQPLLNMMRKDAREMLFTKRAHHVTRHLGRKAARSRAERLRHMWR